MGWSVGFAEWINKVRDEVFFGGSFFDNIFFVFNDELMVGDFNYFFSGDGELGISEAFNKWALNYNLQNLKIITRGIIANSATKMGAFFGFNFEANRVKI